MVFYLSAAAFVGGMIRALRASVERNVRDRLGIALAAGGLLGLAFAAVAFVTGPKTMLPF